MSLADRPAPGTGLRAVLGRTPLRVRLVAALVVLVAIALLTTSVASASLLRGYLLHRVDEQLTGTAQRSVGFAEQGLVEINGNSDGRPSRLPSSYYLIFTDARGTRLVDTSNQLPEGQSAPSLPSLNGGQVAARSGQPFTVGSVSGDGRWRAMAEPVPGSSRNLIVAVSLSDVDATVSRLTLVDVLVGITVLILLALLGFLLVRSSLRPLREVELTAAAIAGGDLTRRAPEQSPRTEVGRLSDAFNMMVDQIETSVSAQESAAAAAQESEQRMRRFVADASHELRTPLTSIRGFAELHRQGAVSEPAEVNRVMRRIEKEAARMGLLVEDLLTLARLDQQRPLERTTVDLLELVVDAVHDAQAVDPQRTVDLVVTDHPEPALVRGDDARLRQVLGNLVTNALHHTPAGSAIRIHLDVLADRRAVIEVTDRGPGLSAQEKDRIFERFYRADSARARQTGGSGLGLSIVAALVAAHGGTVEVHSEPGEGATFRVLLPLLSPRPSP